MSAFISERVYWLNRCWRGTSSSPWWRYSTCRCFASSGEADVVVRGEQQAGPFAFEPLADRVDFARLRFLFGDEVVQAEHHQRVRVGQHPFVNRQLVAGLVDALKHGDGMPGRLTDDLLE